MMNRSGKWLAAMLVLAGFAFLGLPRDAHATLQLRAFIDGSAVAAIDVTDTGLGTPGSITLPNNTPVGGVLTVNGSISTANYTSPGSLAQIASQSLNVINTSGASHTVLLQISANDFNGPPSPLMLESTGSGTFSPVANTGNSFVTGAQATVMAFASSANTLFGNNFLVQNFSTPVAGPMQGLLSYNNPGANSPFSYVGAYSMTLQVEFTLPNNVQLNGRANVEQATSIIPEPGTIAMALAGVPVLGGYWLRRRRKQA